MPGYETKQESIAVAGVDNLHIRSLRDRQQFADPLGLAERLGISSATWPLFGLLWPSGGQLATRLAQRTVRLGERVLEMGCGLALPSLVAHRLGMDITASDSHPLTARFLRNNLRLNGLAPMKYRLVGGDLLYDRDASMALAGFIGRHAQADAEVWIVDPDRGNRPAFSRQMLAMGFALTERRLDTAATAHRPLYKGRLLVYRRTA